MSASGEAVGAATTTTAVCPARTVAGTTDISSGETAVLSTGGGSLNSMVEAGAAPLEEPEVELASPDCPAQPANTNARAKTGSLFLI